MTLWDLGRCPSGYMPSAYQIRYAGCKGMVTLQPSLVGKRCAGEWLSLQHNAYAFVMGPAEMGAQRCVHVSFFHAACAQQPSELHVSWPALLDQCRALLPGLQRLDLVW